MISPDNPDIASQQLLQDFTSYTKNHDLTSFKLTGEFRLVKREDRQTIIAMVELGGVSHLFSHLQDAYQIDLPVQPTHITLFILRPGASVVILTNEKLKTISQKINIPELAKIKT